MIRSAGQIGDLWPRCETCGHIAQSHDHDSCCEIGYGKCSGCGQWTNNVSCSCKEYKGPTWQEFVILAKITDEELAYYHWSKE